MSRLGILTSLVLCVSACYQTEVEMAPPVPVTSATIETTSPAASLAPNVELKQFVIPNHNAFPEDAIAAPDGSLWFTEAKANAIGRLDVLSGDFREFPLRVTDSRPHSLAADRDGNIWFTANAAGYIGKLDPKTGGVTEYRMPDARAKDPHSLAFAPDGSLWFTVLQASAVGRLDPASGKVNLLLVDQPGAQPYDIGVDRNGAAYFSEYGLNLIRRIDPQTMQTRVYHLPAGARARGLAVSWHDENALFYTDFARGKLGRLDIQSGAIQEWSSPNGATAQPYAISLAHDGAVWFSETGPRPSTIVRFDPQSHTFASVAMPEGAGVVRSVYAAPDNRVFIASGNDRITVLHQRMPVASR
jgi:virginiamycin B lyase